MSRLQASSWWVLLSMLVAGLGFGLIVARTYAADDVVIISFLAYAVVGAVVTRRRPSNSVGWIFLGIGGLTGVAVAAGTVVTELDPATASFTAGQVAALWVEHWFWYPMLLLATTFTVLLFPEGLPSSRWRPVLWGAIASALAITGMAMTQPTLTVGESRHTIADPLSPVASTTGDEIESHPVFLVFLVGALLCGLVAVASIIVRFRRAQGSERAQLRWFALAISLVAVNLLFVPLLEEPLAARIGPESAQIALNVLFAVVLGFIPVACGIAITRHGLYEIDRIVSRTVSYTVATGVVLVTFALVVTSVSRLMPESSDLAVAGATLTAAAVVRPVLRRVQAFVDRRFNRSRFDAVREVDAFASGVRGATETQQTTADLVGAVQRTLAPRIDRHLDERDEPMTDQGLDAVVVGAGPNGLVAAVVLAEAGWRVLVLEAADEPGGGVRTEEVTLPGFRHDICSTAHPLALASPAFRALGLEREGLAFAHAPVPLGHPLEPGRSVLLHRDVAATAAEIGVDGRRWGTVVGGLAGHWERMVAGVLDPVALPPREPLWTLAFGAAGVWPMSWVERLGLRTEEAGALLAGISAHAVLDLRQPMTTAIGLLLGSLGHAVGWPVAVGGSQSIADALVARLESLGGEVRCGHRVRSMADIPEARAVLFDLTPRQVLAITGDRITGRYRRRLEGWRYGSGSFKVDWALDGPVPWADQRLHEVGTVHLGGTAKQIIEAERVVASGRVADEPYVLVVQATVADPSRAPAGKHTAWGYCHVPHGCDVDVTGLVEAQVERMAPGFRDRIIGRHSMGPAALEAHNANEIGGDIGGGSTDVRQLFARPILSLNPWATPDPGIFLCSSSTVPGGGVHGMCGWHAAHAALRVHSPDALGRRTGVLAGPPPPGVGGPSEGGDAPR